MPYRAIKNYFNGQVVRREGAIIAEPETGFEDYVEEFEEEAVPEQELAEEPPPKPKKVWAKPAATGPERLALAHA
jgi:hypothetical protein